MRTCTNCGAQFPDDELICPVCGQEVQLVPDYVTIESHMQEDEFRKQEEEKKKREEEEREAEIEARKKQIRRNVILFIVLAAAGVIAVIAFISLAKANKNAGSFAYMASRLKGDYIRRMRNESIAQAEAFAACYETELPEAAREVLKAFIALKEQSKIEKIKTMEQYGFWKNTLSRRVGQLWKW